MDKQASKHVWFGDHHTTSVRLDKPVIWIVHGISDELDFTCFTVKAHPIAALDLFARLVKEWQPEPPYGSGFPSSTNVSIFGKTVCAVAAGGGAPGSTLRPTTIPTPPISVMYCLPSS
jgi:hypothetical protein